MTDFPAIPANVPKDAIAICVRNKFAYVAEGEAWQPLRDKWTIGGNLLPESDGVYLYAEGEFTEPKPAPKTFRPEPIPEGDS